MIEDGQRHKSLEESIRVLKKNGIYAISYVNRYANIIEFRKMFTEDFELLNEYLEKGFLAKNRVFYCSTPELIEKEVMAFGLKVIHHVATDGMKFIIGDTVNDLTEDKFRQWMDFHLTCNQMMKLQGGF